MKDKRDICKIILKCITYLALFTILSNSKIGSVSLPFASALLFVCLYNNFNIFIYLPCFLFGSVITSLTYKGLIISLSSASVAILLSLILKLIKKQPTMLIIIIAFLLGQTGYIFFNIYSSQKIIETIIVLVIGICYIYFLNLSYRAYKQKEITNFLIDERISLVATLISFAIGISDIYYFNFDFSHLIFLFIIVFVYIYLNNKNGLLVCLIVGIGTSIKNYSFDSMTTYVIIGFVLYIFNTNNKYFISLYIVISKFFIMFLSGFYLNINYFAILPELIVALILIILPKKLINHFKIYFNYNQIYTDNFLNKIEQDQLKSKLKYISDIFYKMQDYYRKMTIGDFDLDVIKEVIADRLYLKSCKNCERCNFCTIQNKNLKNGFSELALVALNKDKVNVLDIPKSIITCGKPNTLLNDVVDEVKEFRKYEKLMKKEDSSKLMIGEQLYEAGSLISEISKNLSLCKREIRENEEKFIKNLRFFNIFIKDLAIFNKNGFFYKAYAFIGKCQNIKIIEEEFSKKYNCTIKVHSKWQTPFYGFIIYELCCEPVYDILIGKATEIKTGSDASGDKYSLIPLDDGKFMIAISDGRGSGEMAESISENTLSLIEAFYKAGFFSKDIILSVNKMISFFSTEQFSAIDICVVDLNNAKVEMIKLGSTPTIIKSDVGIDIIESNNLPLGIIKSISPTVEERYLKPGDVIILSSDGVYDSFSNREDYLEVINSEKFTNMTMVCENIIEEGKKRNNLKVIDDMTVIAFKVITKS